MRLFIALLLLFPMTGFAVKVPSIYRADIPVVSQEDDIRASAAKEGLMQVLIKVSGDPQIVNHPAVKNSIKNADALVEEFGYASTPNIPATPYLIKLRFDAKQINALLKNAGASSWGGNRPSIMVWLVIKDKPIISNDLSVEMKRQGKKYGLPLVFPVMDAAEMSKVSSNDVTTMKLPALSEAAKRYSSDAMLIGYIEPVANVYQGKWELVLDETKWTWDLQGATSDNVVDAVLSQVNQTLAKHYAVNTSHAANIVINLQVSNVTQKNDLFGLVHCLKQSALVKQVQLSEIDGDVVKLVVVVRGSLAAFQQNTLIRKHLLLKSRNEANNQVQYEWIR